MARIRYIWNKGHQICLNLIFNTEVEDNKMDEKYFRKGFGLKDDIAGEIGRDYHSAIIDHIKSNGYEQSFGETSILLAKEYGFCYGVDRSVEYAYQTVQKFPERRIYLTGEIIHNPYVNNRLIQMGVRFLSGPHHKGEKIADIMPEDVVILPAFGVSIPMLTELREKNCIMVDTTCGSVLLVWKHVERFAKEGYTALVHGKYYHEETIATVSRSAEKFLIVLNENEAQKVCDYIRKPQNRAEFIEYFAQKMSPGFDPDRDLQKIGVANQTTMLAKESLKIGEMVKQALIDRYGAESLSEHFRAFDTICSATQERQDAITEMLAKKPDLAIVIGGFNSSNTKSLTAIAQKYCSAYHIEDPDNLLDAQNITHLPVGTHGSVVTCDWLPSGRITVAVTAGASTPDAKIGQVIKKIVMLRGEVIPSF